MSAAAVVTAEDLRPDLWADPWWRLCNLYDIVNERNEVVRFVPNDEQRQLYDNLHYRNLILKARQLGFTTFICILALDQCLFNTNFSAGIIAHNREDAEKFFRNKVIFAYDRLPEPLRGTVSVVKKTESQVTFANGSTLYVSSERILPCPVILTFSMSLPWISGRFTYRLCVHGTRGITTSWP